MAITKKTGMVIVATAGVGKTYLGNKYPNQVCDLGVMDYTTTLKNTEHFSNEARKCIEHTNAEWPYNYFKAIKEKSQQHDIVCVAFLIEMLKSPEFADQLKKSGIKYKIAIPKMSAIESILERLKRRGNNDSFIKTIAETYPDVIIEFSKPEYSSIIIDDNEYLESALIREKLLQSS